MPKMKPYMRVVITEKTPKFLMQTRFTVITRNVGQCPTWWPPCRI